MTTDIRERGREVKKLYIYEYISPISTNYHDGGGLVIVTDGDPQAAWEKTNNYAEIVRRFGKDCEKADLSQPDRVIDVPDSEPDVVYVFLDAGCC